MVVVSRRIEWTIVGACCALFIGCGGGGEGDPEPDAGQDTGRREPPDTRSKWTRGVLKADGARHLILASGPSGQVGAALFDNDSIEDGQCDEVMSDTPPVRERWPLSYAEWDAPSQTWSIEEVSRPLYVLAPTGVDIGFNAAGEPQIAAMVGDPVPFPAYCGANDVGLITRSGGTWTEEVAVATSGQAATGEPGSDYGEVVGYYPTLAYDANGDPAIAYKDVHSGSIQSDDRRRADLELAWRRGGGWDAIPVDFGVGAGNFNQMLFDRSGAPIISYYMPTESLEEARQGIWVTRSGDDGATWDRIQLYSQANTERPAMATNDETGELHVVYYRSDRGYPVLATLESGGDLTDLANAWTIEDIGDSRYDEGYAPSMAVSPSGRVAVAYYRCTRSADELGDCKTDEDAVVFAWRDGDGTWEREIVDEGEDGFCGEAPSLAFDVGNRPVIAYRCDEDGQQGVIKFAVREALP
jgi:hypothetical protein